MFPELSEAAQIRFTHLYVGAKNDFWTTRAATPVFKNRHEEKNSYFAGAPTDFPSNRTNMQLT
jgi:hypothetical protein